MEPEGLFPCSQGPDTEPYRELYTSSTQLSTLFP